MLGSHFLKADWLDTPLGSMIAMADEKALYVLEFMDRERSTHSAITTGRTEPIDSIAKELRLYFEGKLELFQTPIKMTGSAFQTEVWSKLQQIPLGKTCSYAEIARAIKNPLAVRAVGRANAANLLAIIIPCHRVINANGDLGGYSGGIKRKEWLLNHEKR